MAGSVISTQKSPINARSRSPMRALRPTKLNPNRYSTSKFGTHNVTKTTPIRHSSASMSATADATILKQLADILLSWSYNTQDNRQKNNRITARRAILKAIYHKIPHINLTSFNLDSFPENALTILNRYGITLNMSSRHPPVNSMMPIFEQLTTWLNAAQEIGEEFQKRKALCIKIVNAYKTYKKIGQPIDLDLSSNGINYNFDGFPRELLSLFEIRTLNINGNESLIDYLMGEDQRACEKLMEKIKNISYIKTEHYKWNSTLRVLREKNSADGKDGELLYQFYLANKAIGEWIKGASVGEKREEAFSRIMNAFLYRCRSVDLSGLNLKTLPNEIDFFLYKTSYLNLSNNKISEFPKNFNTLNLAKLNLENNNIVSIKNIPYQFKKMLKERALTISGNPFSDDFFIRDGRVILSDRLQGSSIDEMLAVARIGFWKIFNEWITQHKPDVTPEQKNSLFNQCGLLYPDRERAYQKVIAFARNNLRMNADFPKKLFDMMSTLATLQRTQLDGAQYANDYDKVLEKIIYSYLTQDEMILNLDGMGLIKIPECRFDLMPIFNQLPIKSLSLANNRIKSISTERYPTESKGRFLSSLPEMDLVDLTNNGMNSLYLANNGTRIGQLNLSGNNIRTNDPSVLIRLDEQDLKHQPGTYYGLLIPSKKYNVCNKYQHFLKLLELNLNEWKNEPGRYPGRFVNRSSPHVYRDREIASNKMIDAYKKKRSTLDLSDCDIINIPDSIIYLENLNHLIIHDGTAMSKEVIQIMNNGNEKRLQITRNTGQERITNNLVHTIATELVHPSSGTNLFVNQENTPLLSQPVQPLLSVRNRG